MHLEGLPKECLTTASQGERMNEAARPLLPLGSGSATGLSSDLGGILAAEVGKALHETIRLKV